MSQNIATKAAIPNPALEPLTKLIGQWTTTGTHPLVPGTTLQGKGTFELSEGGAFITMHSQMDDPRFPQGIAIFASDNGTGEFFMLYFDERKISRKYNVSIEGNVIKWWRNSPDISQRYSWTMDASGNKIIGKGEISKDGKTWEPDLEQTFTRVQ